MRITVEEVRATAKIARLYLNDTEQENMQNALDQILNHAASLQTVDVTGIEPTTHAIPMVCPLREDKVGEHFPVDVALQNAPGRVASFFAVPAILAKEDK